MPVFALLFSLDAYCCLIRLIWTADQNGCAHLYTLDALLDLGWLNRPDTRCDGYSAMDLAASVYTGGSIPLEGGSAAPLSRRYGGL